MSILAIQVDSRGVTALSTGSRTTEIVPLTDEAGDLAAALREKLPSLRGAKPRVGVALGPDAVKVRRLPIPPAPEAELPPIVALQAAREAGVETEDLVVDFLPPTSEVEGPAETFVCWTGVEVVAFWQEVTSKLGGELAVLTARPLALGGLIDDESVAAVASRSGDAVDIAITGSDAPRLLRSAHVGDNAVAARRELTRSLLSADGESVSAVLTDFETNAEGHTPIDLSSALGDGFDAGIEASTAGGLFASMSQARSPSLNLADPRKPPVVETGRRRLAILAAAAAAAVLAGVWVAYDRVAALDRQIAEKKATIAAADETLERFEPIQDKVAAIDAWRRSDVTWLDELERLGRKLRPATLDAKDFPAASDVRVSQVRATALLGRGQRGGKIDLTAQARSSSTRDAESRLRDETHPVEPISIAENTGGDAYRYDYSATLLSPAYSDEEAAP